MDVSNGENDFKTPKVFKINVKSTRNGNITRKKTVKKGKKLYNEQNLITDTITKYFKEVDTNLEHAQLAIALSASDNDNTDNKEHETKSDSIFPTTQEKILNIRSTLEKFGFNSNLPVSSSKITKRKKKLKNPYVTPILLIRTEQERRELITQKVTEILKELLPISVESEQNTVKSPYLSDFHCKDARLFTLGSKNYEDLSIYYLKKLDLSPDYRKPGYLLKDWSKIPGRSPTPEKKCPLSPDLFDSDDDKEIIGDYDKKSPECLQELFDAPIINLDVDEITDKEDDKETDLLIDKEIDPGDKKNSLESEKYLQESRNNEGIYTFESFLDPGIDHHWVDPYHCYHEEENLQEIAEKSPKIHDNSIDISAYKEETEEKLVIKTEKEEKLISDRSPYQIDSDSDVEIIEIEENEEKFKGFQEDLHKIDVSTPCCETTVKNPYYSYHSYHQEDNLNENKKKSIEIQENGGNFEDFQEDFHQMDYSTACSERTLKNSYQSYHLEENLVRNTEIEGKFIDFQDDLHLMNSSRKKPFKRHKSEPFPSSTSPSSQTLIDEELNYSCRYDEIEESTAVRTPQKDFQIKTSNVTPNLNYEEFDTPKIVKELHKFGVKPLKRKRGIQLLKYIYESTHPLVETTHKGPKVSSGDSIQIVGNQLIDSLNEQEMIFERFQSKRIPSCKVPLDIVWHNFVSANRSIRENIILYEPLELEVLHAMLKEQGYRYNSDDLLGFLNKKCISVRHNVK